MVFIKLIFNKYVIGNYFQITILILKLHYKFEILKKFLVACKT